MTRDTGSRSALLQVAALAVLAVIASQIVTFIVILTAPPPRPAGFSIGAAASALRGEPAETSDGRALTRKLTDRPLVEDTRNDPLARVIATSLARSMDVPVDQVRVAMARPTNPPGLLLNRSEATMREMRGIIRRPTDPTIRIVAPPPAVAPVEPATPTPGAGQASLPQPPASAPPPSRPAPTPDLAEALAGAIGRRDVQIFMAGQGDPRFTILTDRLTFQPFAASVRLQDGRWATVRPPQGLIEPWQARLLMSLAISLVLLAPIVWLLARRLTRPIRVFAAAAERLADDPDAEPLKPTGPREVRTAIGVFNDMQAALRGHIRRRTQTVAAIAHDLRTPLTRLRFRAEQAPEALRDRMVADVEEMDALIGQALAYVRGEAPPERHDPFDLAELAADVVAGFAETGAAVGFERQADLPARGDPVTLRRALSNLIDNAVRYGCAATVTARRAGPSIVIAVADDGPGLPPERLDSVFEPFERGEASRNRQTGGTGLGLTVARQAARAHGGDVVLSNRPEGGLEARLHLPIDTTDHSV